MKIIPYSEKYKKPTVKLILGILENEFHAFGKDRPDLLKISEIYQVNKGNFWIAVEKEKVVGTIGLRAYGNNRGYLKRMYVDKSFRGTGLASELLYTLVKFAKKNNYKEIFLTTFETMIAANKFYSKMGFKRIDSLPEDMPSFGDTVFYKIGL